MLFNQVLRLFVGEIGWELAGCRTKFLTATGSLD